MPASRKLLTVAFVALLTLALSACGSAKTKSTALTSKDITIPFVADMSVPDPDVFYDVEGDTVTQSVYDGLVQYAPGDTAKIVPDLATAWTISPDKKTYTFTLRSGVKFHDGATLTSADVKRSFLRRAALNQGSGYMVAGIKSMDTPDATTFVVHLKTPVLPFMDYLASLWGPRVIGPDALVKHAGSDHAQKYLGTHGDGTGPYELASFKRGSQYVLKAFPGYYGAKPFYTTVRLSITPDVGTQQLRLKGGEFAMMLHAFPASELSSAEKDPNLKVALLPTQQTLIAYVNTHKAPFSSASARAAIAKVIDPRKLVAQAYGDTASVPTGPYPPAVLSDQPPLDYGTSAPPGAPKTGHGKITIAFAADEVGTLGRVSQLLQVQLGQLGYDVQIQQVPHPQIYSYTKHPAGGPDILLLTNNPDAAHPDTWAGINFGSTGGTNLLADDDPVIDADLKQALSQPSESAADKIYRAIGRRVIASHSAFFLANVKDTIVYRKGITDIKHVPLTPWMVDLASLKPAT